MWFNRLNSEDVVEVPVPVEAAILNRSLTLKAISSVSELQMRCRRPPAKFHGSNLVNVEGDLLSIRTADEMSSSSCEVHGSNTILISLVYNHLYRSQVPAVGSALRLLHLAGLAMLLLVRW